MSELPSWVPALQRPRSIAALRILIGVVVAVSLLAFVVRGADQPPDPHLEAAARAVPLGPPIAAAPRVPLDGFGETRITVKAVTGDLLSWCLLLAATAQQQQRGLMTVSDPTLGGYDGMLFRFDHVKTNGFWMRNTPMPLSIAYIGADGALVTALDMTPCDDVEGCPNYPPAGPYVMAIEVPQSVGLARLRIEPGAIVVDDNRPCT